MIFDCKKEKSDWNFDPCKIGSSSAFTYLGREYHDWKNTYNFQKTPYIAIGSSNYIQMAGDNHYAGGMTPSKWNYPGVYDQGVGNDVFGIQEWEGRLWAGMLVNQDTFQSQTQMLFYSDDAGKTWAQSHPLTTENSWTAGFIILQEDCVVSDIPFKKGNVIAPIISPELGWRRDKVQIWVADNIYQKVSRMLLDLGALKSNSGISGYDPHPILTINGGKLCLSILSNHGRLSQDAYVLTTIQSLIDGSRTQQPIMRRNESRCDDFFNNYEVGCPFVDDKGCNYLFYSRQAIDVAVEEGKKQGKRNTIQNGVFLLPLTGWSGVEPKNDNHLVDIGYDFYAQAVGKTKLGGYQLIGTVMNWGANEYKFNGATPAYNFSLHDGEFRVNHRGFKASNKLCGDVYHGGEYLFHLEHDGVSKPSDACLWGKYLNNDTRWDLNMGKIKNILTFPMGYGGCLLIVTEKRDFLCHVYNSKWNMRDCSLEIK